MRDSNKVPPRKLAKRVARLNTVQALFQMEASNQGMDYVVWDFIENGFGEMIDEVKLHPSNMEFFKLLLLSAVDNQQTIDNLIHAQLPANWSMEKIDPTIRAIFRAGGAEMMLNETPVKVILNEFVEITKSFFPEGKEVGFVNSIMQNLVLELNPVALES